jgi:hypothetical protein
MLEVKTFKCTFKGRRLGASGIYENFEVILECTFDEVIPRLYESYQDVHNFKMLEYELGLLGYAVEKQWNYVQVVDASNWNYKTNPTPRKT